ncbi:GNAT family N-acetyltransferase [Paenalkalicoccus suaedae]|uniref:GNAT family N-acetyltransferase n=1 Tax=Paenalkalicoccus suaedae TaxID=2592382 RepID=A0A859F9I8_9BACI|nr:GNAT family N-acetyltransferase [Paenalkalicoccus suaedae]QKS69813.1 GNAT family N-acetyltransferase [Paenalkalicoccus suaedae]
MSLSLERLTEADAKNLLAFERDNRAFFEAYVPSRGESYFVWDEFLKRHDALLAEQADGTSSFFLLKENGQIVGRVNVTDIVDGVGDLGYRVGADSGGKGYATEGVRLALARVDATVVRAKTLPDNVGSQRVLEKAGFKQTFDQEDGFVYFEFRRDSNS